MDRKKEILKYITKTQRGLEMGPFHSPLTPKREGYNCLVLDVFDAPTLRATAGALPEIPRSLVDNIEEVDLLGATANLRALVDARGELGTFDYVVSSHNLEHLPDPIGFLQSCGDVLKPGGKISMAIPDRRTCFDYFRPHSTLAAWIEAFLEKRNRPSLRMLFEMQTLDSRFPVNGELVASFALHEDPRSLVVSHDLKAAFANWQSLHEKDDGQYRDTHCWTFTPSSFELLATDVEFLGLSPFKVLEISQTNGNEFYAHLENVGYHAKSPEETAKFYKRRLDLLHAINNEAGVNSARAFEEKLRLSELSEKLDHANRHSWTIPRRLRRIFPLFSRRRWRQGKQAR